MQEASGAPLRSSGTSTPVAPRPRARGMFALVALVAYALDLGSKEWALAALRDGDVPLVGDLLVLHLTFNPGAAFSMGTQYTIVFTVLAAVAVAVVLWVGRRVGSRLWAVGLGLLLGGVGGNLTDRVFREPELFRGHVVDFLMLPHWPVFNIADMCINGAVVVIIVQTVRGIQVDGSRVPEDP